MLVNLNDVLKKAQEGKYAVGLFNTADSDMLQAVIEAAEELNSPVIIGTAEVPLLSLPPPERKERSAEARQRAKAPPQYR